MMGLLGKHRQMLAVYWISGAEVAIGWKGPRYSAGALGLKSQVSI